MLGSKDTVLDGHQLIAPSYHTAVAVAVLTFEATIELTVAQGEQGGVVGITNETTHGGVASYRAGEGC